MKFLCPIDFSAASINGSDYAAHLAKSLNANLTLIYVQPVYAADGVTMFSMGEPASTKEAKEAQSKLADLKMAIEEEYGVATDYHVDFSFFNFENEIADESQAYDLIITGSNGTETLNQFYAGSHSYKLAKHARCPVMIIPADCTYTSIEKVVFASAYNTDDELVYEQLQQFMDILKVRLQIVHISESDNPISQEVFASFSRLTREKLGSHFDLEFTRIIHKDAAVALNTFMSTSKADLLIMCFEKHGLLHRMFNTNLIKKITAADTEFPILITHK